MRVFCHRCGGELCAGDGVAAFCPQCGAPQLFLQEQDKPETTEPETTGSLPPPRPRAVEWKIALRCAAGVATVAGALSLAGAGFPALTPLNWLWILSGSLIAVAFYQKRLPKAKMDAAIGARIGVATGIALVVAVTVAMTAAGLVARYGLHRMGGFDAMLAEQMHTELQRAATANPIPPELMRYFYSPEFSAGMMLAGIAMLGGVVLLLSVAGGALGGMLRARRSGQNAAGA